MGNTKSISKYFYMRIHDIEERPANISYNGPDSKYFSFVGQTVSTLSQLLNSTIVAQKQPETILKHWVFLYFNKILFIKTDGGLDLALWL